MKKVLGMGNALVDILISISDDSLLKDFGLPKGSMQLVDKEFSNKLILKTVDLPIEKSSGGSAANTIHGLAKLGVQTGFIGKIADDELGKTFKQDLLKNNINNHLLSNCSLETGRAATLISSDSERTFATYLGAAITLSPEDVSIDTFKLYDILHIEGYLVQNHNLLQTAVSLAKEAGLKVSLDLASYNVVEDNLAFLLDLVSKYVDILFANEEEAKAFTGLEPEEALDKIAQTVETAIVKVGKNGSYIKQGSHKFHVDIIPAERIDTTGAGDLYAAGFLYGIINNLSLDRCGEIGTILSGNVIEVVGAKIDNARWKGIGKLIHDN